MGAPRVCPPHCLTSSTRIESSHGKLSPARPAQAMASLGTSAFSLGIKEQGPLGFPGGTVVKNPPANAGDKGSSPGPGRSHMPRSN